MGFVEGGSTCKTSPSLVSEPSLADEWGVVRSAGYCSRMLLVEGGSPFAGIGVL